MAKSAKLTSKKRRSLPKSKFALPAKGKGKDKYPIDTPGRAANAKSRATQQYKKGRISASNRSKINAAANRALKRFKGSTKRRKK